MKKRKKKQKIETSPFYTNDPKIKNALSDACERSHYAIRAICDVMKIMKGEKIMCVNDKSETALLKCIEEYYKTNTMKEEQYKNIVKEQTDNGAVYYIKK